MGCERYVGHLARSGDYATSIESRRLDSGSNFELFIGTMRRDRVNPCPGWEADSHEGCPYEQDNIPERTYYFGG